MEKNLSYYFSARDNESEFYGLLHTVHNRFYVLSKDYPIIKFLQLLLAKNFHTFTCVTFNDRFDFSKNKNIDNNDCSDWGGSHLIVKNLFIDIDFSLEETKLVSASESSEFDEDLQKNIMFTTKFLTEIYEIFNQLKHRTRQEKEPRIKGLNQLEKHFEIILPEDKTIKSFINEDIDRLTKHREFYSSFLDDMFDQLLCAVYEVSLYNCSMTDLKRELRDKIPAKTDIKTLISRFKKTNRDLCIKLDEIMRFH